MKVVAKDNEGKMIDIHVSSLMINEVPLEIYVKRIGELEKSFNKYVENSEKLIKKYEERIAAQDVKYAKKEKELLDTWREIK